MKSVQNGKKWMKLDPTKEYAYQNLFDIPDQVGSNHVPINPIY